jgi:molecular chaperone DnaK
MAKSKAVGIDLGTTYSAMAWVNESNHSTLIPNDEGDLLTPSVVLFEDKSIVVGKEAKKVAVLTPDRVASCVKRDMGKPVFSRPIRGKYMPPEVIQSYILKKLKDDITRKAGPEFRAIITVPAYFDEPRRKATYQAGEMAGLKVLDIVNEPTAAALAFGEDMGYLTRFGAPKERMNVIVYDLGGGTFDVTLIDMQAGDLRTVATDGDVQLGGFDWDMRLVDILAEAFKAQHGTDPRQSPEGLQRMLLQAEETKHTLSARSRASVTVVHEGLSCDVPITREQFEDRTADLLERTRYTTRQLLNAAGLQWKDIKRIFLTGGSTRMPAVVKMLRELSGIEPDMSVNPDEAVARGAAVYANYLLASKGETGHAPTFDVSNVNAHSLGVEGVDPRTMRKRNKVLIPRNTRLPAKKVEECITKQVNQNSVVVQVLEGESLDPKECTPIGRTVIRDLPPNLPQGWPVEVTYEYGVNGCLNVKAKVRGTDREVSLELEHDDSMSADRLNRWKRHVASAGGLDAFEQAIQDELDSLKGKAGGDAPTLMFTPHQTPTAPMTPAAPAAANRPAVGPTQPATPAAAPPPAPGVRAPVAPVPLAPKPLTSPAAAKPAAALAVMASAPAKPTPTPPKPANAAGAAAAVMAPPKPVIGAAAPAAKPAPKAPTQSGPPGWLAPVGFGTLALGILVVTYLLLIRVMPEADFIGRLMGRGAASSGAAAAADNRVVIGLVKATLHQDPEFKNPAGDVSGGSAVTVQEVTPAAVHVTTADGRRGWLRPCDVCTASEHQRRKAAGQIPVGAISMGATEEGGFQMYGGTLPVTDGQMELAPGNAIWPDETMAGKSFGIGGVEYPGDSAVLYYINAQSQVEKLSVKLP